MVCALAMQAQAASLQLVNDWGASGVPTTVSMYIYVPDNLADGPPILVLSHYCGGSAAAVFGQAQAGGIVAAADQYGFIMIVPQAVDSGGTGRCWDVGTTASLTHDGGGDTQAIAQMVQYTLSQFGANPDRVYATGDSSGGMMTEALLAVYPDIFKAGSSFAGVPAGCWAVGATADGTWSSQCAGGSVSHTPQEWGDIVRAMYPGYTGHRPRVQLFHGDTDVTISFTNHTEAIKEWTNVLGLSTEPTTTDEGVQLGTHQATRERWENSCGYVVLDAFTSHGGDHGPSDALFEAQYVIPFLGLDQTGPVDPEIEQCNAGSGGTGGTGGTANGGSSNGGTSNGGTAGSTNGGSSNGGTAGATNGGSSNGGTAGNAGRTSGGTANGGANNTTDGGASTSGAAGQVSGGTAGEATESGGNGTSTGGTSEDSGAAGETSAGGTAGEAQAGSTAEQSTPTRGNPSSDGVVPIDPSQLSDPETSGKTGACACGLPGRPSKSPMALLFGGFGLFLLVRRRHVAHAKLSRGKLGS